MRVIEIEIKNWSKYNPRSDAKSCTWFRMSNSFFLDPDFYGASLEARMVWVFILASSSQKMSAKIKINTQMIADNLSVRVESIDFAIDELFKIGCIMAKDADVIPMTCGPSVKKMSDDVTFRNERTNEHNERTNETKNYGPHEVITILNSVCLTSFKPNAASHARHINARIAEGYNLDDFALVIKYRQSTWANNPKMSPYLRPETLFGPKFDSYLQEARKNQFTAISELNPTGNPYTAQRLAKTVNGEIA